MTHDIFLSLVKVRLNYDSLENIRKDPSLGPEAIQVRGEERSGVGEDGGGALGGGGAGS